MRLKSFLGLSIRTLITSARARKMRIETDGSTGTVTFHPDEGKQSGTVILMHGLGDSAEGLSDVADTWCKSFPHLKFVLPTASSIPVTMNGGMRMNAWYDIVGIDDRASESCEGIHESVSRVRELIAKEHALGLPHSRIALAGFSQGGAMSLFTGLQLPEAEQKLAGLLVLSGYLPGAAMFNLTPGLESTPVFHCHGSADPVVRPQWADKTQKGIKAKGVESYELQYYNGVGHSINMDILRDANTFLNRILPHDPAYIVKPKEPSTMSVKELKVAIRNNGLASHAVGFTEKHEFVTLLENYYASKA